MSNSIISVGDEYRIYGSEVVTHNTLPVGTYDISFHPMSGYSLVKTNDLTATGEKVYGSRDQKVDKIMNAWETMDRSLGVMLSGDKGQGKSLFLRMLADAAREHGLPVVRVTKNYPGIADFIDSLGECAVVFDEFEKVFKKGAASIGSDNEDGGSQDQFLSMFDGVSRANRIYCLTFNSIHNVSEYLLNRPGRFHYHLRFDYPTAEEVEKYLRDNVTGITDKQISDVVTFSRRTGINYDHLRAIAFEFRFAPDGEPLSSFLDDLNIKPVQADEYMATIQFVDGPRMTKSIRFAMDDAPNATGLYIEEGKMDVKLTFSPVDIDLIDGRMVIPGSQVNVNNFNDGPDPEVDFIILTLKGQKSYSYGHAF